jgi:hypothetical protein
VVPLNTTFAPGIGSPSSALITVPVTVICASVPVTIRESKPNIKNTFFITVWLDYTLDIIIMLRALKAQCPGIKISGQFSRKMADDQAVKGLFTGWGKLPDYAVINPV